MLAKMEKFFDKYHLHIPITFGLVLINPYMKETGLKNLFELYMMNHVKKLDNVNLILNNYLRSIILHLVLEATSTRTKI